MKGLLRSFLIHSLVIWLVAEYIGGIGFGKNINTIFAAGLALMLADTILKPLINLLLLPFNLITLGVFRWVSSALMLYITTLVVPNFSIHAFRYNGLVTNFFIIPQLDFSPFAAYIVLGILISFVVSLIFWLFH